MSVFAHLKAIPSARLEHLLKAAGGSRFSNPGVKYPSWYLQRWHFLPDGYLSSASIRLYDRFIRRLYHAADEARTEERVATQLGRLQPESIAEFGCGPGRMLSALGRAFPSARLMGIDLSPFMLEAGASRLGAAADLIHADACWPVLPAGRTDVLVAVHVLGHIPLSRAGRMAGQARRALRPGGVLVTVDHRWHAEAAEGYFQRVHSELVGRNLARLTLWEKHLSGTAA